MKTYGELAYSAAEKAFGVRALEPHVAMAFKRLFPRVPEAATEFRLSDTDEIRADLQWFMMRYPLANDCADVLDEGVRRVAERLAERDRILLPTWRPASLTGFKQGRQPYLFQAQAARIAVNNGALLLGDDVGLGKTITAAAALVDGAPLPAAIVVQAHLSGQWATRLEEFTSLRVHVIKGTKPYDLPEADVYIFRYSNVAGWVDVIGQSVFKSVVYDEVQELRHGRSTSKGMACAKATLMADFRLGLTATPVYNYGDEIHAVMEFIKPELLGRSVEFSREWCGNSRVVKDPDGLGSYLRGTGFFLRRTEDDPVVSSSLLPANIVDWEVAWDEGAAASEQELTKQLAMTVLRGDFVEAGRAARELDLKMRQMTGIAKARSVAAYVRMLLNDAERVLLAGWHRDVYAIWQEELAAFNPVLYTGTESAAGKARSVDAFCGGDSRVMMISLRSGAGLDGLQHHCREVVFGELDWSPQVHHQVIGRLRRPGQQHQVTAHYLHTNEGSDPVLIETLGIKSDQARGINDPGVAPKVKLSDDSRIKRLAQHVLGIEFPFAEQAEAREPDLFGAAA